MGLVEGGELFLLLHFTDWVFSNLWCRQMSKAERHVTVTVSHEKSLANLIRSFVSGGSYCHCIRFHSLAINAGLHLCQLHSGRRLPESWSQSDPCVCLNFGRHNGKSTQFLAILFEQVHYSYVWTTLKYYFSKHFRIQMKKKLMCLMCKRTEFSMIMRGDSAGQAGAGTQLTRSDINIRDLSDLSRILDQWLGAGKNLRIRVAKQSINRNRFEDETGEIDTSVRSATDSPLQPISF